MLFLVVGPLPGCMLLLKLFQVLFARLSESLTWRYFGFQKLVLSLFQDLFCVSELAFPSLRFLLEIDEYYYLDWNCGCCAIWIGAHWLATWNLELGYDGYSCCFASGVHRVLSELAPISWQLEVLILNMTAIAAVLPRVFTLSLRNDAHSYISDNVMGTHNYK